MAFQSHFLSGAWEHAFVNSHPTNHKESTAELKIAAAAEELGIPVLAPMTEHGRYDLVFVIDEQFLRVQSKWAAVENDVVLVRLRSQRLTSRGRIVTTYSADEIDAVAAYCGDLDRCFLLPIELVAGKDSCTCASVRRRMANERPLTLVRITN